MALESIKLFAVTIAANVAAWLICRVIDRWMR